MVEGRGWMGRGMEGMGWRGGGVGEGVVEGRVWRAGCVEGGVGRGRVDGRGSRGWGERWGGGGLGEGGGGGGGGVGGGGGGGVTCGCMIHSATETVCEVGAMQAGSEGGGSDASITMISSG